jgi:hypothetical protein
MLASWTTVEVEFLAGALREERLTKTSGTERESEMMGDDSLGEQLGKVLKNYDNRGLLSCRWATEDWMSRVAERPKNAKERLGRGG